MSVLTPAFGRHRAKPLEVPKPAEPAPATAAVSPTAAARQAADQNAPSTQLRMACLA